MKPKGQFTGVGVGPGPAGLVPVAALDALRRADIICLPRADNSDSSVARQCLAGLDLPESVFRDIPFTMDPDRRRLAGHYTDLAARVAGWLENGLHVAYVTIGDSMTYSTYGYLLDALRERLPDLAHRTFPGVTSFAATAAALSWPLGEGKERMLILPCPDDMAQLEADILANDIVILMKIGHRLGAVLALLRRLGIDRHCAFARRIGLPGEILCDDASRLDDSASGYLATLLIRRQAREKRHL